MNKMSRELLGRVVRDRRSGVTGKVIGVVTWLEERQTDSLVVQPPVRDDSTVPPTVYVPASAADVVPTIDEPRGVN